MNRDEFLEAAQRAQSRGFRWVQVKAYRRSRPRNWDRIRLFPGVYGRCIGECDQNGWYLIDVLIEDVRR